MHRLEKRTKPSSTRFLPKYLFSFFFLFIYSSIKSLSNYTYIRTTTITTIPITPKKTNLKTSLVELALLIPTYESYMAQKCIWCMYDRVWTAPELFRGSFEWVSCCCAATVITAATLSSRGLIWICRQITQLTPYYLVCNFNGHLITMSVRIFSAFD